jgi:hypothetical protein
VIYANAVLAAQGTEGVRERFRLRWTENAEHGPLPMLPTALRRAPNTWLIDYLPAIEQSLKDLVDWVEEGIEPGGTAFSYESGKVTPPKSATERGGIEPLVRVFANGADRTEVQVGEPVTWAMDAEVPPGVGTIVSVEWDFDGGGTFPFSHPIDGTASMVALTTEHAFDRPGTYFATARVSSHRDGDVHAASRRVPNLAQARIVVS